MERISITCAGCGQVLATDSDDPRGEVECLWCGTKTPVTVRPVSPSAVRAEPPPRSRPAEPSPPEPAPPLEPPKLAEEPPPGPRWFEQPGYSLAAPSGGRPAPELTLPDTRTAIVSAPGQTAPTRPSLSEDEDSAAYQLEGRPDRPCPNCASPLPGDAILCPACGFDQVEHARTRRIYEPMRRCWDTGWPLPKRIRLFVIGQVIVLPLGLLGSWVLGQPTAFLIPWLLFSGLTAFLLGTYASTDLTRTERGKVQLQQTWRVCFLPRPPQTIRRSDYEGVTSGKAPPADFWDWIVLICLTLSGIVLGVLWWYYMIRRDSFYVALTRDHGFPERTLYWGWDEEQARDMARTIDSVAFAAT
ncbi:MAG: hypothetical protein L0Z62_23415 [Gemmataceae bacterium]|nr:hypothetical protein [Gemmataceae bacterium]